MNKIIIIAVFIFWLAVSVFYANSLFNPKSIKSEVNNINTQTTLGAELVKHNNQSDCWIAISNKVYNVTGYLRQHPGGANIIIKYCGQDATQAFASKDKSNPQNHSSTAYAMLDSYYIGDLNTTASTNSNNLNNISATNTNQINNNNMNDTNNKPAPLSYTLTTDLVAQHNQANDCWVTAGNNVYNVTSYIRSHPGGANNITKYCGTDIAAAFASQGHSMNAKSIFASYKIGTIGTNITADSITTPPPTNQNTGPINDDEEEEDD